MKKQYSLKHLLSAIKLAKSVFYYHVSALQRPVAYEKELARIESIYHEHKGRYGYRRIHLTLKHEGITLNHKTVQRLMGKLNLKSTVRPKKYRSYRGNIGNSAPNYLKRDFTADKPNEKWVTDVTEFNVEGKKVYLSPIIDLYNQEVVAYEIAKAPRLRLVTGMIERGLNRLTETEKPLLHSDQGWQYRNHYYQKQLADNGIKQSMSRKGNCLDNAVAENFFGLLKSEMYHGNDFKNADELIEKISEYIEYYNTKRIKAKLKGLTPVEYRNQALQAI
ncbi:IS3 family transposase [Rosenbergiella epipactidis]|uniref:IS3 family transposase n=1 Tax=Rosenbergiella epipactidis TaxID=1544694 RepID=UPI001F4E719B|nr:IS3 family transposase [Rosenbergiella epipactidis]